MFKRIILIVMDSVGIGHGIDAEKFGDARRTKILNISKDKR